MNKRAVEAAGMVFAWLLVPNAANAAGYDPYAVVPRGPIEIDMAELVRSPRLPEPQAQPDLKALGRQTAPRPARAPGQLPEGWVQLGEVVQREEVAMGLTDVPAEPSPAWEDLEGNQYPRKHTLFLNFNGGKLLNGPDNSALSMSTLARGGEVYPVFGGAESSALAIVQAVQEDMASLGVVVVYAKRPSMTLPYTMAMVSGDWQDTNISDPAGGVAPGTDCEARGQRHVVYVFDKASSTVGQEAAHAWGLDHTMGGDRIMSYQAGSNKHFGDNCQDLCEEACQGPGSIGCRLIHEKYCGVGSEQQNDLAELSFIFGTNEPDEEPPEVTIVEPSDDQELEVGDSVKIKGFVHDNYGGVGWRLVVVKDGKTISDEVDFDKALAWNFSNLPKGLYEVTLEAEDHFKHVVSDTVVLAVGVPLPAGETEGGTSETEDTGNTPTEGFDPSSSSESTGGPDQDDGGGCRISGGAGGPAGLLVPALGLGLAWRGRRRARRSV